MSSFSVMLAKASRSKAIKAFSQLSQCVGSDDPSKWVFRDRELLPGFADILKQQGVRDPQIWKPILKFTKSIASDWPVSTATTICISAAKQGIHDSSLCGLLLIRLFESDPSAENLSLLVNLINLTHRNDVEALLRLKPLLRRFSQELPLGDLILSLRLLTQAGLSDPALSLEISEAVQARNVSLSILEASDLFICLNVAEIVDPHIFKFVLKKGVRKIEISPPAHAAALLRALAGSPHRDEAIFLAAVERVQAGLSSAAPAECLRLATLVLSCMAKLRFIQFSSLKKICDKIEQAAKSVGEFGEFPALLESLAAVDVFLPEVFSIGFRPDQNKNLKKLARAAWSPTAGFHTPLPIYVDLLARAVRENNFSPGEKLFFAQSLLLDGPEILLGALASASLENLRTLRDLMGCLRRGEGKVDLEILSHFGRVEPEQSAGFAVTRFIPRKTKLVVQASG